MGIQNDLSKKKTKKDHHKPKKIIAADRPHPNFRHFMVEKYEIKVYLNLLKLTKYERILCYIWISAIKFVIRSTEWGGSIGVLAFDARRDAEVIRAVFYRSLPNG